MEFTLGSHQWGEVWVDDEHVPGPPIPDVRFNLSLGDALLFDYRTVHRGTLNRSPNRRSLTMLIFGRSWWQDITNYGMENYGGANEQEGLITSDMTTQGTTADSSTLRSLEKHFFLHLARLWTPSIAANLRTKTRP